MRILVTGGAGFIGSNLVKTLLSKSEVTEVVVLDFLTYAANLRNLDNVPKSRLKIIIGDVANGQLIDGVIEDIDFVYHLAAETHVTRSIYDNYQFFHTDVMGTQSICNAVLRYSAKSSKNIPLIHISTSEVYGSAEDVLMDELHPLNPCSPYAAAKAGADRLVYSYGKTYGLNSLIIRPFNQYGPHQHPEKLVPRFITSCILEQPMSIHGDGTAMRDWTHVYDTTNWLASLIDQNIRSYKAEVFNIGSGVSHSINDIASIISANFSQAQSKSVSERPGQVSRHTCNSTKAKNELNWSPKYLLETSIESVIAWYKQNQHVWDSQMLVSNVEIEVTPGQKILH
jgi:dTDP-glucose 4,6-dehydratase